MGSCASLDLTNGKNAQRDEPLQHYLVRTNPKVLQNGFSGAMIRSPSWKSDLDASQESEEGVWYSLFPTSDLEPCPESLCGLCGVVSRPQTS